MPRQFAEGFEPAGPEQLREWYCGQMVAPDGAILCEEAFIILKAFCEMPTVSISAVTLAKRLFMDPYQTRSFCRQLATHKILEESPPLSTRFRLSCDAEMTTVLKNISSQVEHPQRDAA